MEHKRDRRHRDERQIDDQIARAKIAWCLHRYFETRNDGWLITAQHLCQQSNGFLHEVRTRIVHAVDDVGDYLGFNCDR